MVKRQVVAESLAPFQVLGAKAADQGVCQQASTSLQCFASLQVTSANLYVYGVLYTVAYSANQKSPRKPTQDSRTIEKRWLPWRSQWRRPQPLSRAAVQRESQGCLRDFDVPMPTKSQKSKHVMNHGRKGSHIHQKPTDTRP